MEAVPADSVGRERLLRVDEDEEQTVPDDEMMTGAGNAAADIAGEASGPGGARSRRGEQTGDASDQDHTAHSENLSVSGSTDAGASGSLRTIRSMSAEDKREPIDIFRQLRESQQIDVRYGRARLTVFRFGGFTEGDLGAAVKRFERGEINAESLSWVFVRSRVVKHT